MGVGWMFGNYGCHATSKDEQLSYKIGYLIMEVLFRHVKLNPVICILCICMHLRILHSFVLVLDLIFTVRITSYLALNVRHIFHIYSSGVSDWCNQCNDKFNPLKN